MGTREELGRLTQFLLNTGLRPQIDSVLPLAEAKDGFSRLHDGDVFGKIVFNQISG